ncbi:MAG TPA: CHRD domain-containing protein [Bryobacteraceae bacterium]|nr:CHRD domain-containing protein [Bryobacteraceae bacterium]
MSANFERGTLVTACVTAVILASFAPPGATQTPEKYKVRLATVPMDGGMREAVAGSGAASAVLTGTKLTLSGTFEGLRSPATAARLHSGPARGVRGAALADLTVSKAISGTVTGTVDLTREQVQSLQSGRLYVQISSEKAPEGNLWGWLLH